MGDSPVLFKVINTIITFNTIPHMAVIFILVPTHRQENVKRGRVKRNRQQLINFNHKEKHKIGFYTKHILIFSAYQVQGWWNMIVSPVKDQLYGGHFKEILLKSSWHTHLQQYTPYIFILQKLKISRFIFY